MAHKKAGGTATNLKDSPGQRLGVKRFGGEAVKAGGIIVRQRGTGFRPGDNTRVGKDHTVYATADGTVKFQEKRVKRFDGKHMRRQVVSVEAK